MNMYVTQIAAGTAYLSSLSTIRRKKAETAIRTTRPATIGNLPCSRSQFSVSVYQTGCATTCPS